MLDVRHTGDGTKTDKYKEPSGLLFARRLLPHLRFVFSLAVAMATFTPRCHGYRELWSPNGGVSYCEGQTVTGETPVVRVTDTKPPQTHWILSRNLGSIRGLTRVSRGQVGGEGFGTSLVCITG